MDAEARRPEDQQACAHLRVLYTTEQIGGGLTRGGWACDLCRVRFVPVASAEYEVAQAIKTTLERCARYVERRNSPFPPSDTDLEIAEAIRRGGEADGR
jgi:hypothetical protein